MVMAGEYADTLRALGRFLDGVGASEITVIEERDRLGVVWRGKTLGREARYFAGAQLHALRTTARLYRGLELSSPRFTHAELLRMLGTMVDEANASGVIITEMGTGFRLSAFADGREMTRTVAHNDVVAHVQTRHPERPGENSAP
jgi:hypothetical protein